LQDLGPRRKLAAILAADAVGFSKKMGETKIALLATSNHAEP